MTISLSFRLLTEYYSFLLSDSYEIETFGTVEFPSPYGVLFILIYHEMLSKEYSNVWISVSLRSIIHSYYEF